MEFSFIGDLLKRIKLPTSQRELGGILESYLASKGIKSSCKASSLGNQTLYIKTDPSTRQYLYMHKEEVLAFLNERAPQHNINNLA